MTDESPHQYNSQLTDDERLAFLRSVSHLLGNANIAFLIRLIDEARADCGAIEGKSYEAGLEEDYKRRQRDER
jgi:hypothetical protein